MRTVACLIGVAVVAGCATPQEWLRPTSDGRAVESAILWEAELDERWIPVDMARLVRKADRFEPEGNFYRVKGDLVVFGHRATYVGMLGVDLFAGPNAVLIGSPASIAACLAQHHGAKFEQKGGAYVCDYKKDVQIIIEKHPGLRGASIIIGAYTGP